MGLLSTGMQPTTVPAIAIGRCNRFRNCQHHASMVSETCINSTLEQMVLSPIAIAVKRYTETCLRAHAFVGVSVL